MTKEAEIAALMADLSAMTLRVERAEADLDSVRAMYHRVCRDLDDANALIMEMRP